MPQITEPYLDLITKFVSSLVVLLATLGINQLIRNFLGTRLRESGSANTLKMLVRNAVLVAGTIFIVVIWLGAGSDLTVAMGIFGAGVAFASQETIGSFTGFVNIVTGGLYQIGDRVRVGNVTGDVIDISLLRTTVMEIGEWVKADQYTGRVVTVANRAVFSDPVYNYTKHWRYLWDEITIPITYGSDWRRAAEMMLEHGQKCSEHLQEDAQAALRALDTRFPAIEDLPVTPTLYTVMTDNWVEMTLRYVVDAHQRRAVQTDLHRELLAHFGEIDSITVASTTVEIVGFPPIKQQGD